METPATAAEVAEWVKKEVVDWDDQLKSTARFKAFSGQRSDWETQFRFWRDLILQISRHFHFLILSPSLVKSWFNRGGLVPLCLHHVLLEMYKVGDLVRLADLEDTTSGRVSRVLRSVVRLAGGVLVPSTPHDVLDDQLIVIATLEDKVASTVKALADCHWTSTCIVTRDKFTCLCGGPSEAAVMGRYMCGRGKAKYLSVKRNELIEGFKVSLSPETNINIISLDHDNLQLVWTAEKLQHQLDVIDQRYEMSRQSALASLKEGNKRVALRHARALKLTSESREKLTLLINRVDEVLRLIADAESTKKVSEAIQIAGQAMKENKLDIEQLDQSLQDLGEAAYTQQQINDALGSSTYAGADYDDIEEELNVLELEIRAESSLVQPPKSAKDKAGREPVATESADLLAEAMSGLKLVDGIAATPGVSFPPSAAASPPPQRYSKAEPEAA